MLDSNLLVVMYCIIFCIMCAIIKELFDSTYKKIKKRIFIINIFLSIMIGTIVCLIFFEAFKNPLELIGWSGFSSIIGPKSIRLITCFLRGESILEVKLKNEFEEIDDLRDKHDKENNDK